ncbi:hypothetical protein [Nesterenkonia lutea]|uniref:Uncharacterized protein n=1 Tax=Nesterenkonia lutea TaxID=272919 RepID=A0ABR9JIG0_9MICC|nr:hypothetical protein [Nesterenkonia lutea]MBE1525312.1 hypothetical protein [Nesterenkonia lutea]
MEARATFNVGAEVRLTVLYPDLFPVTFTVIRLPWWAVLGVKVLRCPPLIALPSAYQRWLREVPVVQVPGFTVSFVPTAADPEIFGVPARRVFPADRLVARASLGDADADADAAPVCGAVLATDIVLATDAMAADWVDCVVVGNSGGGAEAPIRVAANTAVVRTEVMVRQCWELPMAFVSSVRRPLRGTGRHQDPVLNRMII